MFNFVKSALFRGLIILIPAVLIFLTLRELVELMIQIATPIADMISPHLVREGDPVGLIALLLILATAVLLGLLWSAGPTRRAFEWVESNTLGHLPMYRMMKSLVAAYLDLDEEGYFKPGCLRGDDGTLEPVYVIEEHNEDMLVVLQPWTPAAFAGSVKIVPRDRVQFIPVTLDDFSLAITHYGIGLSDNLKKAEAHRGEK